jgi:hypothetical protein
MPRVTQFVTPPPPPPPYLILSLIQFIFILLSIHPIKLINMEFDASPYQPPPVSDDCSDSPPPGLSFDAKLIPLIGLELIVLTDSFLNPSSFSLIPLHLHPNLISCSTSTHSVSLQPHPFTKTHLKSLLTHHVPTTRQPPISEHITLPNSQQCLHKPIWVTLVRELNNMQTYWTPIE